MMTLKAEKRDPQVKAKKLRREGFVTGVLYGKEMKENVALKFEEKEALRFMKDAKEGAQATLAIEGETVNAMVKNIDYDPMSKKVLALAKAGKMNGCLIEGMGCPGGCVAGAGTNIPVAKAQKKIKDFVKASSRQIPPKELEEIELK